MNKLTWLLVAALVVFLAGFALALVVVDVGQNVSAGATIRCTLAALVALPLVLLGSTVGLKQWWEHYQKHQRLQEQVRQAEIYRCLQGSAHPPRPRRRSRQQEQEQERGDIIQIVLGDGARERYSDEAGW
jgi:hypothetical protein